jgi:enoyl-[acyl-carrier protein] reductase II
VCSSDLVVDTVSIPVVAAGGIADHRGIKAALALGAQGVQMGTRFLMTKESSAHENFKQLLLKAGPEDTMLLLKKHVPVRLLINQFAKEVKALEDLGASKEELENLLGKGRAKKGIFEGDLENGELEIGQICSMIKDLPSVAEVMDTIIAKLIEAKIIS